MPSFRYQALSADGAMQNGTVTAPDRLTAMRMIQQKGETPLDLAMSEADAAGCGGPSIDLAIGARRSRARTRDRA